MNRKKALLALLACIVLFAGAVMFSLAFSGQNGDNSFSTQPIVLSEILAGNRTYIAPNGQHLDYVEIRNNTDSPVDISGYMISDRPDFIGYTFPQGTILQAHSYMVCWCDKESDSDRYGKFGISRKGDDTILLYNKANVLTPCLWWKKTYLWFVMTTATGAPPCTRLPVSRIRTPVLSFG